MHPTPPAYRDLGFLNGGPIPEVAACQKAGHVVHELDLSSRPNRETDVMFTCEICRICWHVDSSD